MLLRGYRATARVNTAQIRKRGDGLPGSAQGPHPASQVPPTPTRGTAPPYDDTGRQGKGGYLSGIDRKGRDGVNPSSTQRRLDRVGRISTRRGVDEGLAPSRPLRSLVACRQPCPYG